MSSEITCFTLCCRTCEICSRMRGFGGVRWLRGPWRSGLNFIFVISFALCSFHKREHAAFGECHQFCCASVVSLWHGPSSGSRNHDYQRRLHVPFCWRIGARSFLFQRRDCLQILNICAFGPYRFFAGHLERMMVLFD